MVGQVLLPDPSSETVALANCLLDLAHTWPDLRGMKGAADNIQDIGQLVVKFARDLLPSRE